VEFLNRPRTWVIAGVAVAGLFLLYQLWVWEVERVEVPPDKFLVRINLWGTDLPDGEILAPDDSYKGVQKEMLTPGRHFLNPLFYRYEKHPITEVPPGKCLVLTRKAGKEIPPDRLEKGEFLAREDERGIVPEVRLPGKHFINPYLYHVAENKAVQIKATEVGVRTLKWGKDPRELKAQGHDNHYVVPEGYRGVQEKPVPPGDKYFNPYVESVVPVDISRHQVEFADIYFPSRDGFTIQPHVIVAYRVMPEKAPELFVVLSNEGKLHQEDATPEQQKENEILQKFILPLIRGYVRMEGSKYDARDYISQRKQDGPVAAVNPRERLQKELMDKVAPSCREVGVVVDSITVGKLEMNDHLRKLAAQISERERTRVAREKNQELVKQWKQKQEQAAKEALAEQKKQVVAANTGLNVEKKRVEQLKEVAEAQLKRELTVAQTKLEGARDKAKALLLDGKSQAAVIMAENEAKVAGLKTAIGGFPSPDHFAQYHVLMRVSPALSEIFASDSSEFAKMFGGYLAAPRKDSAAGTAARPGPAVPATADDRKPG
jgi:hypothetical protein